MGEAKRRKKLDANFGKEKEISVNVSDDAFEYDGNNEELLKVLSSVDEDPDSKESLFPTTIRIDNDTYEALYGIEIKVKGSAVFILNRIYMASSVDVLGNNHNSRTS